MESLKCPDCGAPINTVDAKSNCVICRYCQAIIAVSTDTAMVENNAVTLRTVQPELKYMANFRVNILNSQGGHLWITKDEVVFRPHILNFGSLDKKYIRIQDVSGYHKGMLTWLSIYTNNGGEMRIAVWNKNEIIREIERRRQEYFESRGLQTPKLSRGDMMV